MWCGVCWYVLVYRIVYVSLRAVCEESKLILVSFLHRHMSEVRIQLSASKSFAFPSNLMWTNVIIHGMTTQHEIIRFNYSAIIQNAWKIIMYSTKSITSAKITMKKLLCLDVRIQRYLYMKSDRMWEAERERE